MIPQDIVFGDVSNEFKDKVLTIADEVFTILKELSVENKKDIDSKQIAERMFGQESLKGLLSDIQAITEEEAIDCGCRDQISKIMMDKFTLLIPAYMAKKLGQIKETLHANNIDKDSEDWMDPALEIVKEYIDTISTRNNELEDFMEKTMDHITSSEDNMSKGLTVQRQRLKDDIVFEDNISLDIDEIKQDIDESSDLQDIKLIVMKKIDEMHRRIELKRTDDMVHIKDTEKTLDEMNTRMNAIKREADEIKRKTKRIAYEANHDALTGVHNRKAYEKKMNEILADVSRYEMSASLMICDIDFFMNINNKWGHKLGDLALRKMTVHIKDRMRVNDFIARFIGDVFVIILPHTDIEGARIAGERLRAYIDKAEFVYKGDTVPLTISIGVSCFRKKDSTANIFERADRAMLLAKKSGRNCVQTEEETVPEKKEQLLES